MDFFLWVTNTNDAWWSKIKIYFVIDYQLGDFMKWFVTANPNPFVNVIYLDWIAAQVKAYFLLMKLLNSIYLDFWWLVNNIFYFSRFKLNIYGRDDMIIHQTKFQSRIIIISNHIQYWIQYNKYYVMNFHELYILMGYTSKSKARGFKLQKIHPLKRNFWRTCWDWIRF